MSKTDKLLEILPKVELKPGTPLTSMQVEKIKELILKSKDLAASQGPGTEPRIPLTDLAVAMGNPNGIKAANDFPEFLKKAAGKEVRTHTGNY